MQQINTLVNNAPFQRALSLILYPITNMLPIHVYQLFLSPGGSTGHHDWTSRLDINKTVGHDGGISNRILRLAVDSISVPLFSSPSLLAPILHYYGSVQTSHVFIKRMTVVMLKIIYLYPCLL